MSNKTDYLHMRIEPADKDKLAELASEVGMDMSEVVRLAIRYLHNNRSWSLDYLRMQSASTPHD